MTDSAPAPRRTERALAWLIVVGAWACTLLGCVGTTLIARGFDLGLRAGFIVETVASLWLQGGLVAAFFLVSAAARRRTRWVALALAPVVAFAVVPDFLAFAGRAPRDDEQPFRVASVNLLAGNHDDTHMIEAIRALDADVIVFPEFTPAWRGRLAIAFGKANEGDYPHRFEHPRPDPFGMAVWSRLAPVGSHRMRDFDGTRPQIRVALRAPGGRPFALYGLHPNKPFPRDSFPRAHADRAELFAWLADESLDAVVLAGDFNATARSGFLGALALEGFTVASTAAGGGRIATWPVAPPLGPAFGMGIDHVLCSTATLEAVAFRAGDYTSSDHLPVVATLVFR